LTQEQLAAELGVAYGTINRWENGHMQPSPLALRQIRLLIDELIQAWDGNWE
jgi:putative transcriptional regulator